MSIASDNGLSPVPGNKFRWNSNRNSYIFIQENAFENIVCKIAVILSRPQCVNQHLCSGKQQRTSQIAYFMGPTWGPPGSCRSQMGPMLVPWTLPSAVSKPRITRHYGDLNRWIPRTKEQFHEKVCLCHDIIMFPWYNTHGTIHRQISNISRTKSRNLNVSFSSCSCLCPVNCNQVLSREWRCRCCSNYIWVINSCITCKGAPYIRDLTVYTVFSHDEKKSTVRKLAVKCITIVDYN